MNFKLGNVYNLDSTVLARELGRDKVKFRTMRSRADLFHTRETNFVIKKCIKMRDVKLNNLKQSGVFQLDIHFGIRTMIMPIFDQIIL